MGKRFGVATNEEDKKKVRLERFNLPGSTTDKQRDFSVSKGSGRLSGDPSKPLSSSEEAERIKKRAERFGAVSATAVKTSEGDKIQQRKERFMDDKVKKRQDRFGVISPPKKISAKASLDEKKQMRALKFGV